MPTETPTGRGLPREFDRPRADELGGIGAMLGEAGLPAADLGLAMLAHFRVARAGEAIVGVGGFRAHGQVAVLHSLAVGAAHRGNGLATRLLACLEAEARRLGLGALYLKASSAAGFFARRGYAPIAREQLPSVVRDAPGFAASCATDAICMVKALARR